MNRSNPFRFDLRNGIRFIAKKFLVLPLLVSLLLFAKNEKILHLK